MNTQNSAQHHQFSEKCKLRSQWDASSHSRRMASIKQTGGGRYQRGCGTTGIRVPCWREWKVVQPLGKNSLALSYEVKHLPFNTAIVCLDIYPGKMKIYSHKGFFKDVHSSFIYNSQMETKAERWNNRWTVKLWCSHTTEHQWETRHSELGIRAYRVKLRDTRVHTAGFRLCEVLEPQKYTQMLEITTLVMLEWGEGRDCLKRDMKSFF